jgi:uncharacterized RDD family membrane protein YckC
MEENMFCASCGSPNLDDAQYCGSCGATIPAAAPLAYAPAGPPPPVAAVPAAPAVYAAPPTVAPAAPQSGPDRIVAGYRAAALGDRLIALILDSALLLALFAVVGTWAGSHWGGISATGFNLTGTGAWITLAINVVVGFMYYWLCEGLSGLTLGKAIAGVRVINENGAPCGLGPSLIRNILRIIDGQFVYLVGYFIAIFSKLRQRLGDHLAHTFVVEKEPRVLYRALFVLLWIVLVAAGFTGVYFLR